MGIPLTGAGIDIYVPSLPAISKDLHTSREFTQLTLSIYILFYGVFQGVWGTLSDSLGRKKLYFLGLLGFGFSSFLAIFSKHIMFLWFARALQGIFVAMIGTVSRAIPADIYDGLELKKTMVTFTVCWAVGPVLSPVLGGYLQMYFGWHASFYCLCLYSLLLSAAVFFMPETRRHAHPLELSAVKQRFKTILSFKRFWGLVFTAMLGYSILTLFNLIAPFLIQDIMHYSPAVYGKVALLIGVVWFCGIFVSKRLVHVSEPILFSSLIAIQLLLAIVCLIVQYLIPMTLFSFVFSAALVLFITSILFTIGYGGSMTVYPALSGTSSSLMGLMSATGTGIISGFASLLKAHSGVPVASAWLAMSFCILMIYALLIKIKGKPSSNHGVKP